MRKIIASEFYTLDGMISDPEDKMEWVLNSFSEDLGDYEDKLYQGADTLLLGRTTYQIFESYWPNTESPSFNKEDIEMARKINSMNKIVFSKTLEDAVWQNSTLIRSIIPDDINKMKQEDGKNMLVIGSSEIVQQLGSLDLIDEYHFMLHPVVLGKGKPLFRNMNDIKKLKLKETKIFSNGVAGMFYEKS